MVTTAASTTANVDEGIYPLGLSNEEMAQKKREERKSK
jgi:hypothetical protein